jgi:hypothetical protein
MTNFNFEGTLLLLHKHCKSIANNNLKTCAVVGQRLSYKADRRSSMTRNVFMETSLDATAPYFTKLSNGFVTI